MSRRRKRPSQLDIDKFLFSQGIPKFELYRPPPKRRYRRKSAATSSQPSTSTQTPPSLPPEAIGSQSTQRNVTSSSNNEPVNITTDRELHDLDADSYEAPLDSSFNVEERSSTNLYTIANHNIEVTETLELQRGGDVNASQQEGRVEISEFAFLPIPETLAAIYIQELLVHQQIIGLRDESGDVAIPDFDIQNRVILVGSYIILSARWAQFPGELEGHKKVYFTCSCMNEAKVRQLETAVFGSNATYADYLKSSYNCLHSQAILLYESLLQCLNDPQRATEVEQDAVESMDPSTAISYDCASRSYGIIKGSAAQVKCISCKNATACRHIKSMDSYFAANDLSRDDFFCGQGSATSDRSSRQACISSSRVPILRKGGFKSGRHFVENDVIHLVPDREGLCSCGAEYSNRDPIEEGWLCQGESYLFDVSEIYSCAVYFIRCSNITCDGTLPYDR